MPQAKILCLHGTQTSAEIFRIQLGQLATRIETDMDLELEFIDGLVETECHKEIKGIFQGPYYTWWSMSSDNAVVDYESAIRALDLVQDIVMEEGPFDGVMGFSQGATLALALLLRHSTENPLQPPHALFKFAIFFSCVGFDQEHMEWDSKLIIPSLHIFDKNDHVLANGTSTAACEPESSKLILHDRGHIIPRDEETVNGIIEAIQELKRRAILF